VCYALTVERLLFGTDYSCLVYKRKNWISQKLIQNIDDWQLADWSKTKIRLEASLKPALALA